MRGKINIINVRLRKLRLELYLTEDLPFYVKTIERKVCTIQLEHKKEPIKKGENLIIVCNFRLS